MKIPINSKLKVFVLAFAAFNGISSLVEKIPTEKFYNYQPISQNGQDAYEVVQMN